MDQKQICLNCQTPLQGEYCHFCGQRSISRLLPIRTLIGDLFSDVFSVEGKIFRTLVALLFKPGLLTEAYVTGQRERYTKPLRLYVVISFVYFLVAGASEQVEVHSEGMDDDQIIFAPIVVTDDPASDKTADGEVVSPSSGETPPKTPSALRERIAQIAERIDADPGRFTTQFEGRLKHVFIALVPLFALLLKLLYFSKRVFFAQHFVFTLHLHCFGFLLSMLTTGLAALIPLGGLFGFVTLLVILFYGYRSLRRLYGQSRLKTGGKLLFLFSSYLFAAVCISLAMLFWTALDF